MYHPTRLLPTADYACLMKIHDLSLSGKKDEAEEACNSLTELAKARLDKTDRDCYLHYRAFSIARDDIPQGLTRSFYWEDLHKLYFEQILFQSALYHHALPAIIDRVAPFYDPVYHVLDLRRQDPSLLLQLFTSSASIFERVQEVQLPYNVPQDVIEKALEAVPSTCLLYVGKDLKNPKALLIRLHEHAGSTLPEALPELAPEIIDHLAFSLTMIERLTDIDTRKTLSTSLLEYLYTGLLTKPALTSVLEEQSFPLFSRPKLYALLSRSTLFYGIKGDRCFKAAEQLYFVQMRANFQQRLSEVIFRMNVSGDLFESEIIKDPDIDSFILLAYLHSAITEFQLGSYFFHKSCFSYYGASSLEKVPLFLGEDKVIHPEAEAFILAMLEHDSSSVTREALGNWFSIMREQPASEQWFYRSLQRRSNGIDSIILRFKSDALFVGLENSEVMEFQCLPSVGMAAQFFALDGGQASPIIRFVVKKDIFNNGYNGVRDVAVANPYFKLPDTADGNPASHPGYTIHDLCFHTKIVSKIPREQQRLIVELGNRIRTDPKFLQNRYDNATSREKAWIELNDMLYNVTKPSDIQASQFLKFILEATHNSYHSYPDFLAFFRSQPRTDFIDAVISELEKRM